MGLVRQSDTLSHDHEAHPGCRAAAWVRPLTGDFAAQRAGWISRRGVDNVPIYPFTYPTRSDLTVGDLITARAQIEIEICSAAAERAEDADLDRLATSIDLFQAAIEEQRWRDAALQHVNVHLALLSATRYPALDIVLRPMQQVTLLSSHTPRRVFVGLAASPNVAGSLILGLGCETIQGQPVAAAVSTSGRNSEYVEIQMCGGSANAIGVGQARLAHLAAEAALIARQPLPLSALTLGVAAAGFWESATLEALAERVHAPRLSAAPGRALPRP